MIAAQHDLAERVERGLGLFVNPFNVRSVKPAAEATLFIKDQHRHAKDIETATVAVRPPNAELGFQQFLDGPSTAPVYRFMDRIIQRQHLHGCRFVCTYSDERLIRVHRALSAGMLVGRNRDWTVGVVIVHPEIVSTLAAGLAGEGLDRSNCTKQPTCIFAFIGEAAHPDPCAERACQLHDMGPHVAEIDVSIKWGLGGLDRYVQSVHLDNHRIAGKRMSNSSSQFRRVFRDQMVGRPLEAGRIIVVVNLTDIVIPTCRAWWR